MSKEQIYDERISPLIAQVIEICQENKIAMIANFDLGDGLGCASALLGDEYDPPEMFRRVMRLLM